MSITGKKVLTKEEKMSLLTNEFGLPMTALIEFVHNDSNHNSSVDFSASNMTDTIRQTIFGYRYPELQYTRDVMDRLIQAGAQGNARHLWIEKAWENPTTIKHAMRLDGISETLAEKVLVNPKKEDIQSDSIVVWTEKQLPLHNIKGLIVGGTPDLIFNGQVEDYKTVSPWSIMYPSTTMKYVMQLSSYRWQAPDVITKSTGRLLYRFPAWNQKESKTIKGYPKFPVLAQTHTLYTVESMQEFIETKADLILANLDKPDEMLPPCPADRLELRVEYKVFGSEEKYADYRDRGGRSLKSDTNLDNIIAYTTTLKNFVIVEYVSDPSLCKICAFTSKCNQFLTVSAKKERIIKSVKGY